MSRIRFLFLCGFCTAVFVLFNCAGEKFPAPLEVTREDTLTSYADMLSFLNTLRQETQGFTMETIASSAEGRDVVLLHFNSPDVRGEMDADKLTVLLYAQQHGDEPSGKEAAILLARDIAEGKFAAILRTVDLYLVPQVNPDGAEKRQRRNANDVDLNRDHLTLTQPEVAGLHEVFQRLMPEVTLDIHEYGITGRAWTAAGIRKNFGSQLGTISNPNISMTLRSFAWNRVLPYVGKQLTQKGIGFQRYLVVSDPNKRIRYSTTALNDGRNSMGIYNTLSFILEGRNGETVEQHIHERAREQLATIEAFLTFFAENAAEARSLVREEREKLRSGSASPRVHLVMDYIKDPAHPSISIEVIDLNTNRKMRRTFDNFYPLVQPALSVLRPQGYAIPPDQTAIIETLKRHRIAVNVAENPVRAAVELYRIRGVKQAVIEDKDGFDVDAAVEQRVLTIPEGYYVVWCNQLQSNLIVSLLEPQSIWGLAPLPDFSSLLRVGSNYPVIRIMRVME